MGPIYLDLARYAIDLQLECTNQVRAVKTSTEELPDYSLVSAFLLQDFDALSMYKSVPQIHLVFLLAMSAHHPVQVLQRLFVNQVPVRIHLIQKIKA